MAMTMVFRLLVAVLLALSVIRNVLTAVPCSAYLRETNEVSGVLLSSHFSSSAIQCGLSCIHTSRCASLAFSVQDSMSTCLLFDGGGQLSNSHLSHNAEWKYFAVQESWEDNPCSSRPCKNGGNCTNTCESGKEETYNCACPENTSGTNCENSGIVAAAITTTNAPEITATILPTSTFVAMATSSVTVPVALSLHGILFPLNQRITKTLSPDPNESAATVCWWMKPTDLTKIMTVVAIKTTSYNDGLVVKCKGFQWVTLAIAGTTSTQLTTGIPDTEQDKFHHFCVTWRNNNAVVVKLFVDGVSKSSQSNFQNGKIINGGSSVTLAESEVESTTKFAGYISSLDIWKSFKTGTDVNTIMNCNGGSGDLVSWTQLKNMASQAGVAVVPYTC